MKKRFFFRRLLLTVPVLFCFLLPTFDAGAQESLNQYYRFPFSLGVNYKPLSSLALTERKAVLNEISIQGRMTLPNTPVLQPFFLAGMIAADSDEKDDPTVMGGGLDAGASLPDYNQDEIWDHRYWFGALGIGYAHRLSKEFEVGLDAYGGLSQSVFTQRFVTESGDWYPVGEIGFVAGSTGTIALNPSYNFSIHINPSLRYQRSFHDFDDFDGFYFGIGFSAHYRFGQDPDAPQREMRSIRFGKVSVPSLFAAMQSYYAKNPIGTVTIQNTDKRAMQDVEVLFYQAGYMDSPTPSGTIDSLEPGESREVPLLASFNREVFNIEGITPVTGEVIVTYSLGSRSAEQRQPVGYDLYDKTSITWDDDRKVAAFITPSDSALRNYTSFIRQACKEETISLYNTPLQFAMQTYHALSGLGVIYQVDPTMPFTEVQDNSMMVDSISLPRNTLKRITGDCDDLTVLYCSLLETVGIESAFITVPGHIYAVFNTGVEAARYEEIHHERDMTINLDGELWIPVEITKIGKGGFLEAWRRGAEQWYSYEEDPSERGFYITRRAQEVYRPVGLMERDLGLQYGEAEDIVSGYAGEMNILATRIIEHHTKIAEENGRARNWNRVGILSAQFGRYSDAEDAFSRALRREPAYLSASVNLANIYFLRGDYSKALSAYQQALGLIEKRGEAGHSYLPTLLLNISRVYYQMNEYEQARQYFARVESIAPETAEQYAYLSSGAGDAAGGARASEGEDVESGIIFLEANE